MGTSTKKETVNEALRDSEARRRRLEAAERLAVRGARGEFDSAVARRDEAKRSGDGT